MVQVADTVQTHTKVSSPSKGTQAELHNTKTRPATKKQANETNGYVNSTLLHKHEFSRAR